MTGIAIIGCGNISKTYIPNLIKKYDFINIVGVYDAFIEKAKETAEKFSLKIYPTIEELLNDKAVEVVLNITTPQSHYEICKECLNHGKNVYVEKPISLSYKEGKELVELAKKNKLRIGCAPDTFMGAGIATCKKVIEDGLIGKVIGGNGAMICHGHESWHPSPEFYYKKGGGPLFDMGPYYITALTYLLGGVESVFAINSISLPERTITSEPKKGQKILVEVNTHDVAVLKFKCGATVTLTMSFDVYLHRQPQLELYGTKGSLFINDPNCFDGEIKCFSGEKDKYEELTKVNDFVENERGLGLAEMCKRIEDGGIHYTNGERGLHVLEVMEAIEKSSELNVPVRITTELPDMTYFKGI